MATCCACYGFDTTVSRLALCGHHIHCDCLAQLGGACPACRTRQTYAAAFGTCALPLADDAYTHWCARYDRQVDSDLGLLRRGGHEQFIARKDARKFRDAVVNYMRLGRASIVIVDATRGRALDIKKMLFCRRLQSAFAHLSVAVRVDRYRIDECVWGADVLITDCLLDFRAAYHIPTLRVGLFPPTVVDDPWLIAQRINDA
jgi:hypothetical protein